MTALADVLLRPFPLPGLKRWARHRRVPLPVAREAAAILRSLSEREERPIYDLADRAMDHQNTRWEVQQLLRCEEEMLAELDQLLVGWRPGLVQVDGALSLVDKETGEFLEAKTKELLAAIKAAEWKAWRKRDQAEILAEAVAGQKVHLGWSPDNRRVLMDKEDRILEAGPGAGMGLRAAAYLLLEVEESYAAVTLDAGVPSFGIGGAAASSTLRYSPGYQSSLAARSRRVAEERTNMVLSRLAQVTYEMEKEHGGSVRPIFMTLTGPELLSSLVGREVTEEREEKRFINAWGLFRKTELWKTTVFAGFKGFERKPKMRTGREIRIHPHYHLLLWAKFFDHDELVATWWQCLRTATLEAYGYDIGSDANQMMACADVRSIRPKQRRSKDYVEGEPSSIKTLGDAVQETLKYAVKPEDLAQRDPWTGEVVGLPAAFLVENIWRASCRVFECLGAARHGWKLPAWCSPREGVSKEELERQRQRAVRSTACQLDTTGISDEGLDPDAPKKPKKRPPSVRAMVEHLGLTDWLQVAAERSVRSGAWFRRALQERGFIILGPPEMASP